MQTFRLPVPTRQLAIALATMGYRLTPKSYHHERTGRLSIEWFCDSSVDQAQKLLDSLPTLAATAPEHPLLVCLYYQEALEALNRWLATSKRPAVLPAGRVSRLLRLLPPDSKQAANDITRHVWLPSVQPAAAFALPHHAAAAVVCGFVPQARLDLTTGQPRFVFAAESTTFPGLTLEALYNIRNPASGVLPEQLGDAQPGEHPACYALQCAANATAFLKAEALVLKNPVHMMRGDGTRSALISEALMNGDARHRDRLRLHLAGLT